ncbi:uncharacterized protein LOC125369298 [Ricinus communis]|uniref:uncharacterized protein LOC125369298 n=1 Tax=Ricinus communis TaxID=3988 RepID=UPI00201B023D|nr:uncharacterized protein LOC125369298 [Ricinus communis]
MVRQEDSSPSYFDLSIYQVYQPENEKAEAKMGKEDLRRGRGYRLVYGTCGRTHSGECWGPSVQGCYRCGKPRHYANECAVGRGASSTYHSRGQSSVGDNVVPTATSHGRGRGGRSGTIAAYVHTEDANQSLSQARVYAVTRQEATTSPEIVTGIIPICRHDAYVLVDPGSTCSFISCVFALKMHCGIESLGHYICVLMPVGGVIMVNTTVRACSVMIYGTNVLVDLIVINLQDFDVILDMDWFSRNHIIVDCLTKEVKMVIDGEIKTMFTCDRKIVPTCLISATTALHLMKSGCDAYLMNVVHTRIVSIGVSEVPIVKEFPDVFPEELSRLPPQ